ncbi:hypothetical protein N7528_003379 [Penicillium herquei]|nr:hypothetical protein N7528_003379 [Penicillium herquei]
MRAIHLLFAASAFGQSVWANEYRVRDSVSTETVTSTSFDVITATSTSAITITTTSSICSIDSTQPTGSCTSDTVCYISNSDTFIDLDTFHIPLIDKNSSSIEHSRVIKHSRVIEHPYIVKDSCLSDGSRVIKHSGLIEYSGLI